MKLLLQLMLMITTSLSRYGLVRAFSSLPASTTLLSLRQQQGNNNNNVHNNNVLRLYMSTAADTSKDTNFVPMTLLSGFLGSGKTTTLKHLLENNEGLKVGVIVNDVASVNIDAKLVANSNSSSVDTMIELDNGCACCSLADELLTTVETLLTRKNNKNDKFDALVVELSGVADPVAIKSNWQMATQQGHAVTKLTQVDRVVTLVDACTFGSDWMTSDLAENRIKWTEEEDRCAGQRKVTELLAEQVEAADVIVLNKIDMATKDELSIASTVASGLNEKAYVQSVEFGKITSNLILGPLPKKEKKKSCCEAAAKAETECKETSCTDTKKEEETSSSCCDDPVCPDSSTASDIPAAAAAVVDAAAAPVGINTDQLGITNFVYKRTRPFHTQRLLGLLNLWPIPIKENLDIKEFSNQDKFKEEDGSVSPFVGVLRSKGFVWMAPNKWYGANEDSYRHDTAMYWSHAGKHLGITSAGKWWGTIEKDEMKLYFQDNEREYERILSDDFVTEEWSDRRQELVFIGTSISQERIESELDKCLLTDTELDYYRQDALRNYQLTLAAENAE